MDAVGFLVTLEARDGVADDVADFLMSAKELVDNEPGTLLRFAFRRGPKSLGIFDIFANEVDRDIHLHGEVRKAFEAHGNSSRLVEFVEVCEDRSVVNPLGYNDKAIPSTRASRR